MAAANACLDAVFDLVLSLDGSLSGEHGIGWVKRAFVGRELDTTSLRLMAAIKRQFDPDGDPQPGVGCPMPEPWSYHLAPSQFELPGPKNR